MGEKLSVTIIATRFAARNGHTNPHLFDGEYKQMDRDRSGMNQSVPGAPGQGYEEQRENLVNKRNQETMSKTQLFDRRRDDPDYLHRAKLTFLYGTKAKPL